MVGMLVQTGRRTFYPRTRGREFAPLLLCADKSKQSRMADVMLLLAAVGAVVVCTWTTVFGLIEHQDLGIS